MKIPQALCFDDVLLVPQYSDIKSRKSDVEIESWLGKISLRIPIISSPMDTVTEFDMSLAMDKAGGLGIIHRYNTVDEQAGLVSATRLSGASNVGAAVGVTGDYLDRASSVADAGATMICVDVAHGHHLMLKRTVQTLRRELGDDVHIMAGNIATKEGYEALVEWGVDSVRVGIGGGSICSTRVQTGHGIPTLQSIIDCASSQYAGEFPIIADGGIRNSGDIVKALGAGADFVMLGSLLAGCDETPGRVVLQDGHKFKSYRGMASLEAQVDWRGHASSLEGVSTLVDTRGPVSLTLDNLCSGIRSGLSYSGAHDIFELQAKASFVRQTGSGAVESSAHIVRRDENVR